MRAFIFILVLGCCVLAPTHAQETTIKGRVLDVNTNLPIKDVKLHILGSNFIVFTDPEGLFYISEINIPLGEQVLLVSAQDYLSKQFRIIINQNAVLNLDPLLLEFDLTSAETQLGQITLTDQELDADNASLFNISSLLQASKDVFLNAVSYEFSGAFFRPRGLDNARGKVLINGVEMNVLFSGRPQWSNWGGLNDAQRNREYSQSLSANEYSFGGLLGTTNIVMRASQYKKGGRLSVAGTNKTYQGRIMGSYSSGLNKKGWAYSLLAARRFGEEGFVDGTLYDANSFFISVEKKLNNSHSINLTAFYTPNRRGRSTAITEEVFRLKGLSYNPKWGFQDDEKRNSSIKETKNPVILLNHYWAVSEKTSLNTNLAYQFGQSGNSRIDNGNNRNPAPNYYQRLPSFFLQDNNPTPNDVQAAFLAQEEFINNGQLDWNFFYEGNRKTSNGLATYVIQEDRTDNMRITFNSILNSSLSNHIIINAVVNYTILKSDNFAKLKDLLGGAGYLDIDYFALSEGGLTADIAQSNLLKPNRVVQKGERYKYNYELEATKGSGFAQAQFKYYAIDFFLGANITKTEYQRTGLFENGHFPGEQSLGKGEKLSFFTYGIKGGLRYKITGRHLIDLNGAILTEAPTLRNSFANTRQNNTLVKDLSEINIQTADLSYIFRSPIIKARLTGFYTQLKNQTAIHFFFTQNALGNDDNSAFVQEIVRGIDQQNIGLELGIEAQLLPTFKVKAAVSFGQYVYTNNPSLYLSGDDFDDPLSPNIEPDDIHTRGIRPVALKNFHAPVGPERAFNLGFEYRDPEFWWIGLGVNYFSNTYVSQSNLRHSSDFAIDKDGLPFNDYNQETARRLLQQEQLNDYFLVNVVGGKSWKIKRYYLGVFASINNALDQTYRTGGFENSRRASYRQQLKEQAKGLPLFGNRYFFGNGATFYLNLYLKF